MEHRTLNDHRDRRGYVINPSRKWKTPGTLPISIPSPSSRDTPGETIFTLRGMNRSLCLPEK